MPRLSTSALTAKQVENIKPPKSGSKEYPDAVVRGLALRVYATGAKAYILSARVNGRQSRVKLADAVGSNAVPLSEVRQIAAEAKDQARAGVPLPRFEKPEARSGAMTFGEIADEYIKRRCPELVRGSEDEQRIRRELLPSWRMIALPDLRRRHARELTDKIANSQSAKALKLHETYTKVLNWALSHFDSDELGIDVSPFANLNPPAKQTSRERALTSGEIRSLWKAWDSLGYPFGDVQKLLLLTAQRRAEVAGMSWSEIDLEKKTWTIPAERSKSHRAHIVHLSKTVLAILENLPRFKEGDFAFTTTSGERPISGYSKAKARTDAEVAAMVAANEAETVSRWRWHDLRRTARTGMAELGVPEIVSERILNHAPRGLIGVYNVFEYQAEKADALQRWANHVQDIVMPPPANVRPLRDAS